MVLVAIWRTVEFTWFLNAPLARLNFTEMFNFPLSVIPDDLEIVLTPHPDELTTLRVNRGRHWLVIALTLRTPTLSWVGIFRQEYTKIFGFSTQHCIANLSFSGEAGQIRDHICRNAQPGFGRYNEIS